MWYEIVPSFCIITAALGLPGWGLYHIHNLTLGNHFRRSLHDRWDRHMYQRDIRLNGNPYKPNGISMQRYSVMEHMDSCFIDMAIEFLGVSFHNILYYTSVYPKSIFESRKKYSTVVYRSRHPEVNQYIDLCLRNITECLKLGQLKRVEFAITNNIYEPVLRFIFDFNRLDMYNDTSDAYLIASEQNLRAFCLRLAAASNNFKNIPEDASFTIYIHTSESTAVAMSTNPNLEDFPFTEVEENVKVSDHILPLRRFSIRDYNIDTYVELS